MNVKKYTIALPAAAGLAALLLTACASSASSSASGSGASSHPSAGATTSSTPTPPASTVAVTQQDDSNWAGYVIGSSSTSSTTQTSFSSVSGSWTQPTADCSAGSPSDSAFWVGLGGYTGDTLEQSGTAADCSASGQASYYVWYELVPAAQVQVNMTVQPGDKLSAHVAVSGDTATISISDSTRHTSFSKQLQMSDPTVSSAEWIAEAPSRCTSSSSEDCHILSLADFGDVTFTSASASAAGRTGSISSGLGPVTALTLEATPGYGRIYATAAEADASPGALSGNGSSFTVSWQHPQAQTPTTPVIQSGPIYN